MVIGVNRVRLTIWAEVEADAALADVACIRAGRGFGQGESAFVETAA